jgi:hypothetical protein
MFCGFLVQNHLECVMDKTMIFATICAGSLHEVGRGILIEQHCQLLRISNQYRNR